MYIVSVFSIGIILLNMKWMVIALFVTACSTLSAQNPDVPFDSATKKISYTQIVEADSLSKGEVYSKALEWIALTYRSANDVIQLKDEAAGKIIAKGLYRFTIDGVSQPVDVIMHHTVSISARDGKARIVISDFVYDYTTSSIRSNDALEVKCPPGQEWKSFPSALAKETDASARATIASFSKALSNASKEDW